MAKDPVCGMDVDPMKAAANCEHRGVTYSFCSAACAAEFAKDPSKHTLGVKRASAATPRHGDPAMTTEPTVNDRLTEQTRRRYDRQARYYDALEWLAERRIAPWRRSLWSGVQGPAVLELGVGTGKNMPFYPAGARLTAIDLAPRMLERARRRAKADGLDIDLRLGDAQALDFPDHSFDEVVATFVFCSVPDPVQGLREARRVLKPGGRLHLLEHVRARNHAAGWLMDRINPLAVRLTGANINRDTVGNVRRAGLDIESVRNVAMRGLVTRIRAARIAAGEETESAAGR